MPSRLALNPVIQDLVFLQQMPPVPLSFQVRLALSMLLNGAALASKEVLYPLPAKPLREPQGIRARAQRGDAPGRDRAPSLPAGPAAPVLTHPGGG